MSYDMQSFCMNAYMLHSLYLHFLSNPIEWSVFPGSLGLLEAMQGLHGGREKVAGICTMNEQMEHSFSGL